MIGIETKRKLKTKVKCITCKNYRQNDYLAKTGGNKEPIGLFCVHCDFPREPEGWFLKLKFDKIKEIEEKRKHQNFDNKTRCPYCKGTDYKKDKDKFIYYKYPIDDKKSGKVKEYLEKEINKIMTFHCRNLKCKSQTNK